MKVAALMEVRSLSRYPTVQTPVMVTPWAVLDPVGEPGERPRVAEGTEGAVHTRAHREARLIVE